MSSILVEIGAFFSYVISTYGTNYLLDRKMVTESPSYPNICSFSPKIFANYKHEKTWNTYPVKVLCFEIARLMGDVFFSRYNFEMNDILGFSYEITNALIGELFAFLNHTIQKFKFRRGLGTRSNLIKCSLHFCNYFLNPP